MKHLCTCRLRTLGRKLVQPWKNVFWQRRESADGLVHGHGMSSSRNEYSQSKLCISCSFTWIRTHVFLVLGPWTCMFPESEKTWVLASGFSLMSARVIILLIACTVMQLLYLKIIVPVPQRCSVNAIFQTWSLAQFLSDLWCIITCVNSKN